MFGRRNNWELLSSPRRSEGLFLDAHFEWGNASAGIEVMYLEFPTFLPDMLLPLFLP